MAISLRHWLRVLAHPIQHDLLLAYNITDWVPALADRDNLQSTAHHTTDLHDVPNETYPQHTEWVPDATQDGDVDPNPGADNNTPPHGMVRTPAENFERNSSEQHPENHRPGDVEEMPPETQKANPQSQLQDNTAQTPPLSKKPSPLWTTMQRGLATPPHPPRRTYRHTLSTKTTTTH